MDETLRAIADSLRSLWEHFERFLPRLIVAFLLLTVGMAIAKLVRKGTARILRLVHIDTAAERAGIDDFLLRGGVRSTSVTIIADMVYWCFLFMLLIAVLNVLGMGATDALFSRILLYVPNIAIALLVLMFGSLFARFMRSVVTAYLSNIGIGGSGLIGHLAQWALLVFILSVALEQLSIGGQVVVSAFQIGFGALCFGLALAFGLAGRQWAARILDKLNSNTW
jgi:hypothetical protein